MRALFFLSLVVAQLAGFSVSGQAAEAVFWLSPQGDDNNPGTRTAPVASLERAADLVRAARVEQPAQPVTVWLAAGDYYLRDTLKLGPQDSGTAEAPVTWRAVEAGRARILGARPVAAALFRPLKDPALLARLAPEAKGQLVELDLAAEGVRAVSAWPDYQRNPAPLCTVFFEGQRLPLSRWPNGEYGYTTMQRVLDSGSMQARQPEGGVFEYREDRPARWAAALAEEAVWVRGFWRVPWTAETMRVKAIDPAARTLSLAVSTSGGIGSKYSKLVDGTRIGDGKEGWFALNLLEEIDQPGEWCVDFKRRKLYLWPPAGFAAKGISLADNAAPLLALTGARFVTLRDLALGWQLGDGVQLTDCESVRLAGCQLQGVVQRGIVIRKGNNVTVQSCDLFEIGQSAIDLLGGERRTLTPSGHQILNNHLYRIALNMPVAAVLAGTDAKNQELVGARIAYNRIHDASYSGVVFAGNDNILEGNEIYRVGLDGGDLGGFYTTGGWTSRGNQVRGNFIHHSENANAIYMDDGSSGLIVTNNLIYRVGSGVFIGGGHDHQVRGNLIIAAPVAIHVDDRGISRKYTADDSRLRGDLDSVPYQEPLWRGRYPALVTILDRDPAVPQGNVLQGNFVVACKVLARRSGREATLGGFVFTDNRELPELKVFKDAPGLDFTAVASSAGQAPLPKIELARYGLQRDEYRRVLPARDLKLLREGNTRRKAFDSQQDVDAYNRK